MIIFTLAIPLKIENKEWFLNIEAGVSPSQNQVWPFQALHPQKY